MAPFVGAAFAATPNTPRISAQIKTHAGIARPRKRQVTALHSHMLDETPRLFFMHFWANDDAIKLARGLRSALEKTNSAF